MNRTCFLFASQIVFGNCGVLEEMKNGKGYVELSTIDPTTSSDIAEVGVFFFCNCSS
jgi:hypothetical protein